MKLEDTVISMEKAKRLKELGVKNNSVFVHVNNIIESIGYEGIKLSKKTESYRVYKEVRDGGVIQYFPSFTLPELAALIGKGIGTELLRDAIEKRMNQSHSFMLLYSLDFVANCLIGMIETGILSVEEVNARLTA